MNSVLLREFLETLRGKDVFFDPLHGNHGDRLLTLAARALLEEIPVHLVKTPKGADFVLINGGGSMADGWFGLNRLARYNDAFPSVPLAVLPSSFHLTQTNPRELIRNRKAPMWLWAREQPSLDRLRSAGFDNTVHLGLDHDLAFSLDRHPMIEQLRNISEQPTVLIVERDDWEGPTGRRRPLSPSGFEFIPERFRAVLRKSFLGPVRRRRDRRSRFYQSALQFVKKNHPETVAMNPVVSDISLPEVCGFNGFLMNIARASVIVSTRLHVAILGHVLGRRTYLVEGSYHKYRGVFEYSMQGRATELLTWKGRDLCMDKGE